MVQPQYGIRPECITGYGQTSRFTESKGLCRDARRQWDVYRLSNRKSMTFASCTPSTVTNDQKRLCVHQFSNTASKYSRPYCSKFTLVTSQLLVSYPWPIGVGLLSDRCQSNKAYRSMSNNWHGEKPVHYSNSRHRPIFSAIVKANVLA